MNKYLTGGLAAIVLLTGCGSDSGDAAATGDTGTAAAVVDGKVIEMAEVQRVAVNFARNGFTPPEDSQGDTFAEKMYYTALERLVEQSLVEQHLAKGGFTVTDEAVQENLAQLKGMIGGEERFSAMLTERGLTLDEVTHDIRSNLVMRHFFDQTVSAPAEVTDADLKAYFDENPELFAAKPEVHARHILILTNPEMDDMAKAEARKQAEAIQKRAVAGEDFAKLANELTQDPTNGDKGGDLGWFTYETMVPEFSEVAFSLKPGEVSDVVETQFGYHVIKAEGSRTSEPMKFEDVKPNLLNVVGQQKTQDLFKVAVDGLRDQAKVEINPPSAEVLSAIEAG